MENSYDTQNGGKWGVLCLISTLSNFSSDMLIRFFLILYLMLKHGKANGLNFKEDSYYVQNGINGSFLGPKLTLLNFPLNLLIRFF